MATMQVKSADGQWVDIGDICDGGLIEYRKKPTERKPDETLYYGSYWVRGAAKDCGRKRNSNDNLALTFDGETGQLKSAEVLK